MKKFIPTFYGLKTIDNKEYVEMENMLMDKEIGSILDIKFGRVTYWHTAKEEKKIKEEIKAKSTTSYNLYFRVVGIIIKDKVGNVINRITKSNNKIINE